MGLKQQYRDALDGLAGAGGRLPLLVNDLVIEEQLCHLRCTYCLTEEFNLLMAVPDANERLTTDHHADWLAVLDRYEAQVDAPVLRASGGELLWLPGSDALLEAAAARYETVQVITNGLLLKPDRLTRLRTIENLQLCISLDGHTPEMNRHRFPNPRMLDVVLAHLDQAVELGFPVEIQVVLTGTNVAGLTDFCAFLHERHGGAVRVFAFPVRGEISDDLACPPGDHLASLVERYDELAAVLPPRAYVTHLADFVATGTRTAGCAVPATMAQLFGDGQVSACPHAWLEPMGDLTADADLLSERLARHPHYELFLQPRPRFGFCRGCATPSDVVNLYLQGEVSDEEIGRCPLYSGPRTGERLRALRSAFAPVTEQVRRSARRHPELVVRPE